MPNLVVMDESSTGRLSSPSPFIIKLYEMLDDPCTDSIVSWTENNRSFVVWSRDEFSRELLPRFFRHNNFSSFIRQLNSYGFRKSDPVQWKFANDDFIRDQPHLLRNIRRRKVVYHHSLPKQQIAGPLSESEREGYEADIKRLEDERGTRLLELQKEKEETQGIELQMKHLKDCLHHIGQRQQTVISHFPQMLQKPVSSFLPSKETHDGKRRLLTINSFCDASNGEENREATPHTANKENLDDSSSVSGLLGFLDSSLTSMEGILNEFYRTSGGEAIYGVRAPAQHFEVVLCDQMHASSGTTDINLCSNSSRDVNSYMELVESVSHAEIPAISYSQLNIAAGTAIATKGTTLKEQTIGNASAFQAEFSDDVLWAQFLTENPGSSTQEVQFERKDDESKNRAGPRGHGKFW